MKFFIARSTTKTISIIKIKNNLQNNMLKTSIIKKCLTKNYTTKYIHNTLNKNLCENDNVKNKQNVKIKEYIMKTFKKNEILSLKCIVLDTKLLRSTNMLLKSGIKKENIILVNTDVKTIQFFKKHGFSTFYGTLHTFINITNDKFDILILDTESSMCTNISLINTILSKKLVNDKSIMFLNSSTRNKYHKSLKHFGIKKSRLSLSALYDNQQQLLTKYSYYDVLEVYNAIEKCHRDNIITRGAPMFPQMFIICKNIHNDTYF